MADLSSRRKLTTILSADVVGYSRLMAANEAATVETLKSYRDIITRLVVRHGGRVAPAASLMSAFALISDATQTLLLRRPVSKATNKKLKKYRFMGRKLPQRS